MRLLALASIVLLGLSVANADSNQDAAAAFTGTVGRIDSFSARFEQQILDQQGELVQRSEGSLYALRPGKLRWQIAEPFPQLIVVDGKQIGRYEEDLEQVIVSPYSDRLEETPAMLLSGDVSRLGASYVITREGEQFVLVPRAGDSLFKRMLVRFDGELLVELVIEDTLGQRTIMALKEPRLNPALAAELFLFEPPEGVDVLQDG